MADSFITQNKYLVWEVSNLFYRISNKKFTMEHDDKIACLTLFI